MRFEGIVYRAHDPRWAFSPLSGDGAKKTGGRFNPPGLAALYLSLEAITALKEATHGLPRRVEPFIFCSYEVDCDNIAQTSPRRRGEPNTKLLSRI